MAAEAIPLVNALLEAMGLSAAGTAGNKTLAKEAADSISENIALHKEGMRQAEANNQKKLDEAMASKGMNPDGTTIKVTSVSTSGAPAPEPDDDKNKKKDDDSDLTKEQKKEKRIQKAEEGRARWGKEELVSEDKIMKNRPSQGKVPHKIKSTDKLLPNKPEPDILPGHKGGEAKVFLEHKELSPEEHLKRELNFRMEHPYYTDRYSPEQLADLLSKLTKHGGPKIKGILSLLGAGALASKSNKAEAEEMPENTMTEAALEASKRALKDLDEDEKAELFDTLEEVHGLLGSKNKDDVELGRQLLKDIVSKYDINLPTAAVNHVDELKKPSKAGIITGDLTKDTSGIIRR